jgi:hypothetical protein
VGLLPPGAQGHAFQQRLGWKAGGHTYSDSRQPVSRVGVVPSMYEMGKFATSIISAQSNDNLYTGVALVNTNANAVTVTLRLRDSNGNTLATSPLTLNPGSQVAGFITQMFPSEALLTTVTLLNAIAALAMIGLSRIPKNGYKTPAATGTPRLL